MHQGLYLIKKIKWYGDETDEGIDEDGKQRHADHLQNEAEA